MSWWQASIELNAAFAETLAWILADELDVVAEVQDTTTLIKASRPGQARVVLAFSEPPPENLQSKVSEILARIGQEDAIVQTRHSEDDSWKDGWRAFFKGGQVSKRIFVQPVDLEAQSHEGVTLLIEPGMAFGTGEHVTTRLALNALDDLLSQMDKPQEILDVGSGSAILCIAAALLGHRAVGVEIDHDAQANAHHNVELNGVADKVELIEGSVECVQRSFPIVVANMLARELIDHSEDIALNAADHLLLSGLLAAQRDAVLANYPRFELIDERSEGDWQALHLRKK